MIEREYSISRNVLFLNAFLVHRHIVRVRVPMYIKFVVNNIERQHL